MAEAISICIEHQCQGLTSLVQPGCVAWSVTGNHKQLLQFTVNFYLRHEYSLIIAIRLD